MSVASWSGVLRAAACMCVLEEGSGQGTGRMAQLNREPASLKGPDFLRTEGGEAGAAGLRLQAELPKRSRTSLVQAVLPHVGSSAS